MSRDWVGGVQRHTIARVVAQGTEHGREVGHIALHKRER